MVKVYRTETGELAGEFPCSAREAVVRAWTQWRLKLPYSQWETFPYDYSLAKPHYYNKGWTCGYGDEHYSADD